MTEQPPKTSNTQLATLLLALIIVLGGTLRFARLGGIPAGMHVDEASISVTAHIMNLTGRDEKGARFPLYPQSTWNPKHPVYFYPRAAAIAIFGMSSWAARLPSALFGTLLILLTYLLCMELFENRAVGLTAALLIAVSPWHTHLSRIGIEAPALPAIFTLGLLFLLKGIKKKRAYLVIGAILMGLCFYTYPVSIVFVPLFILGFAFYYRDSLNKLRAASFLSLVIILIFLLPVSLGFFKTTKMDSYFESASINGTRFHLFSENYLAHSKYSVLRSIAHKPASRTAYGFVTNYIGYLSPKYLFLRGDTSTPVHGTGRFGQMQLVCLPFLLIGLVLLIVNPSPPRRLLLWWFLVFPVGASLMDWSMQHALRSVTALPALEIIAALGVVSAINWISEHHRPALVPAALVFAAALCANSFIYFHYYFTDYSAKSAARFGYGFKQGLKIMKQNKNAFRSFIITDRIPYVYAYIMFYDPPVRGDIVRRANGALDPAATLRRMGYDLCDIRSCMETAPRPALVLARPAQLPPGVYHNRFSAGAFKLEDFKPLQYKNNEPVLMLSRVTDVH